MYSLSSKCKKVVCVTLIIVVVVSTFGTIPARANAQAATVPIGTMFDFNSIMAHMKDFVLDKMAVMIANQLLQTMTASVVTWINTGFEGSPAFLQNPEAFFLDAADQVTGAFIANNGPLQSLCSPFGLDIRLSLALGQIEPTQRYTCTLGEIIRTQKSSGGYINISADQRPGGATLGDITEGNILNDPNAVSVNGASVEGFISGDFSQGGWPAFWTMFSEPENNPFGASLRAQSDLQMKILAKQNSITKDLDRGSGFLSWQKCETIQTGSGPQKQCSTQTPGSVISGTLQRQLNVPADKLVLVKTISDSIDAVLGALVNQMFTKGLAALGNSGSGVNINNRAYLQQLRDQSNSVDTRNTWQSAQNGISSLPNTIANSAETYKANYDQAVNLVSASQNRFIAARSCFVAKIGGLDNSQYAQRSFAEKRIVDIDIILRNDINPLLADLTAKQTIATNNINQNTSESYRSGLVSDSFSDLQSDISTYSNTLNSNLAAKNVSDAEMKAAKSDLEQANTKVSALNSRAQSYQNECDRFPGYYGQNPTR